jgi:hypothetical protein
MVGQAQAPMRANDPQRIVIGPLTTRSCENIFRGIAADRCDMPLGTPDRAHDRGFAYLRHESSGLPEEAGEKGDQVGG